MKDNRKGINILKLVYCMGLIGLPALLLATRRKKKGVEGI